MSGEDETDFLEALDQHWQDYRKRFKTGRRDGSEAAIHDLRVSARRFLALLAILRSLDPHPRIKKIWRFLKKQLGQLDQLHDTQVILVDTTQRLQSLPELAPFQTWLEERVGSSGRRARKAIRASKPSDLEKRVRRIRAVTKKHSGDEKLPDLLLQAVDEAYSKTGQAFAQLDAGDPATIHHTRIRFKQLRYMIEIIQPLLKDYPEGHLDRMHDYQDAMGRVHDTTVLLDRLKDFERGRAKDEVPGFDPQPIEAYYKKQLDELIRAYFERKDDFYTFWRLAADQPFPWEKSHDPLHRSPRNRGTTGRHQQRARRQPAGPDRRRTQEDAPDRPGVERNGDSDRSDPDQPLPTGG